MVFWNRNASREPMDLPREGCKDDSTCFKFSFQVMCCVSIMPLDQCVKHSLGS